MLLTVTPVSSPAELFIVPVTVTSDLDIVSPSEGDVKVIVT